MDTGFFKWVWRFNALAIAGLTLLVGLLLLFEFAGDLFRQQRAQQTVNIDPSDSSVEENLEIGSLSFDEDTGLIEWFCRKVFSSRILFLTDADFNIKCV